MKCVHCSVEQCHCTSGDYVQVSMQCALRLNGECLVDGARCIGYLNKEIVKMSEESNYSRCHSCVHCKETELKDSNNELKYYCDMVHDGLDTLLPDKNECLGYVKMQESHLCDKVQDNVNHPSHYASSCSIECIDVMHLIFGEENLSIFCMINAFKYLWRWKHKNGVEDLDKALWYLDEAVKQNNRISCSDTYNNLREMVTREIKKYETEKNK